MSVYVPSRCTQHQTQRCLLKCNVQQWFGAIVVTRLRVYACAPNQNCCPENTEGSGEPYDHRGDNRASLTITVGAVRLLSNPRALRRVLIQLHFPRSLDTCFQSRPRRASLQHKVARAQPPPRCIQTERAEGSPELVLQRVLLVGSSAQTQDLVDPLLEPSRRNDRKRCHPRPRGSRARGTGRPMLEAAQVSQLHLSQWLPASATPPHHSLPCLSPLRGDAESTVFKRPRRLAVEAGEFIRVLFFQDFPTGRDFARP